MLKAYLRNDSLDSPGGSHNGGLGDGVNWGSQTTKVGLDDGGGVASHDGGLGVVDGLSDGVSHWGGGGVSDGGGGGVSHGGGSGVSHGSVSSVSSGSGVCDGGGSGVCDGGGGGVGCGGGNDGGSVSVGPGSDALKPSLGQKVGGSRVDGGGLGGGQGHESRQHHLGTYNILSSKHNIV